MTAEMKEYKYSPIVSNLREKVIKEAKESTQIDDWFLSQHLMEVERFANLLCDKYPDADRDVVGLGVWYHDIGRLRGQDEGHDVYGAEEAKKVLGKEGFAPDKLREFMKFVGHIDVKILNQKVLRPRYLRQQMR